MRRWRAVFAATVFTLAISGARAASLDGVSLPDTLMSGGAVLRLNGIGLRTVFFVHVHIYVAGLYLQHPSHDAMAILASPEKKVLVFHFVRDVDAARIRDAWRQGFARTCIAPCHVAAADVARFLAGTPAMRAGELSVLAFDAGRLTITVGGQDLGTITDPVFSRAVLTTVLGPHTLAPDVRRALLGED